jgi:hypothetical protein
LLTSVCVTLCGHTLSECRFDFSRKDRFARLTFITRRMAPIFTRPWLRLGIALLLFVGCAATVPRWWCGRPGQAWFEGDPALSLRLAREVAATVKSGVTPGDFTAQGELFKHEWQFGTYQMAALGLLQLCQAHPEWRAELLPVVERAIAELLSPRLRAFDAAKWNEDPLETLETSTRGHAAYLGYLNVVLSLHRQVVPDSPHATLNDRISAALERRLRDSRIGILETYPHEVYPVDNAAVLGSLLLHARATGATPSATLTAMQARFRTTWREPASGLLYQALDAREATPSDSARASGTALAAYFLGFADRELAAAFYESLRTGCAGSQLGFGYLNEYSVHTTERATPQGDIDSGPLIFGISPSATGFVMATARRLGDRATFVGLYRTAYLVGAPIHSGERLRFITGGPLGNALLLALFTANAEQP